MVVVLRAGFLHFVVLVINLGLHVLLIVLLFLDVRWRFFLERWANLLITIVVVHLRVAFCDTFLR